MIYILFISWVTTICVISDAQFHSKQTEDLKSIVDSVKRDVDRHLKMASASHRAETSRNTPEYHKSAVVEDIDNFLKMIQDSMNRHLMKNLGQLSEAKYSGLPTTEAFNRVTLSDSSPEQPSKSADDSFEFSPEIHEIRVGSAKGMPGVHFPNYTDIPRTSFICSDKANLPGFYADLDTGCQVFHVCWPDRRESFLCPMGTIFNQAFKVCDYWYNSNCSLAPYYYTGNEMESGSSEFENLRSMINILLEKDALKSDSLTESHPAVSSVTSLVSRFMPIKAKIVVYPGTANRRSKIVTSASIGDKAHFKSRPRKKNRSSKHSRVRKSVDEYEGFVELVRDILSPFTIMNKSYSEVLQFRIDEALDTALMDIKSNTTMSVLSGYVEKLVKFIKCLFLKQDLPEYVDLEPGSELYEFDARLQEALSDYKVRSGKNEFLCFLASIWYNFDKTKPYLKKESASKFEENETVEPTPLTNLDPRLKVDTDESSRFKDESSRLKVRVKRSATILNPLKSEHKGRINIYSGTKTALIKNYIKLFKTKCN